MWRMSITILKIILIYSKCMLYYSQADGLWGDQSGTVIKLSGPCLSGNNLVGKDMNEPKSQYDHDRGPLPQGLYTIGVLKQQPAVHSQGCLLTPDPGNYMGPVPRSGFFLHLRNPAHVAPDGTNASSDGCVTFPAYADLFTLWATYVHKQGQSQVTVVATVAEFPQPVAAVVDDTSAPLSAQEASLTATVERMLTPPKTPPPSAS
jgi:hypothetical protein